jgi:eukaryotic-like serine/threonine-protein kinase
MTDLNPSSISDDAERRIEALAEEYLAELQAGTRPDLAALLAAHADIAEPLRRRLALVERLFKAARGADGQRFPADQARRLKCPHCGNQIQLAEPRTREVTCINCGSSFRVEPGTTTTYRGAAPGGTIGRFKIAELLGRGAFGEVYKAHDTQLDRLVALKIPRADTFATHEEEERFVREARSCARLVHPGIVQVHEVARDGNLPYIVSDYVEGLTLADLLTAGRPGFRDAAEILAQLADALDYAHRQGVVHRDVKPSNILLSRSDDGKYQPHLTDFGLARRDEGEITITLDGQVLGTPAYMSPEQAVGDHAKIDSRSDVYSLGVVLYELLCGELPFRGNKRMLLHQVLHEDPRPPRRLNDKIPRDLETICLKAMSKDIGRRYTTARDFADDLRRWLRGDAIHARPVGRTEKLWRWGKRNRMVASLAVLLLMAMAVGTIISSFYAIRSDRTASRLAVEKDRADRTASRLADEKDRADERHELARRNLYINRMNLAQVAWENGDAGRVRELLDLYAQPEPNEPDLRGWEWYYQQRLCHTELRRFVTDTEIQELSHVSAVNIAFSPNGERIASASEDGEVRIWEVATGITLATLKQPGYSVAYSPDGRLLAVGGADGEIRLFDSSGERQIGTLKGHTERVGDVAFSPDSRQLISGSDDGSVRVWVVETSEERHKIDNLKDPTDRIIAGTFVAWSPSASRVAFPLGGGQVAIRSIPQFEDIFRISPTSWPTSIVFSPEGARVALGRYDCVAEVWDLEKQSSICLGARHLDGMVIAVAFAPDGERVVSAGSDQMLRIWDARTGAEERVLRGHTRPIQNVAYSPDGTLIASAQFHGDLRLWDAHSDQEKVSLSDWDCRSLAFSPDGKRLASSEVRRRESVTRIWDLESRQPVIYLANSGEVRSVAYSAEGQYLATVNETGIVKLWQAESGQWARDIPTRSGVVVRHLAFSPKGARLAMAYDDGFIQIWDLDVNRRVLDLEFRAHTAGIRSLAFRQDGRRLATGGNDGYVKGWDLERGTELVSFALADVIESSYLDTETKATIVASNCANAITFNRDGDVLITASLDLQTWDANTGKPLRTLGGQHGVNGLAISPDGNRFATSADQKIKVWDTLTAEEVRTLGDVGTIKGGRDEANTIVFSPDGFTIAAGTDEGISIWEARPMTLEIEIERAAHSAVKSAFATPLYKYEVIESLRRNRTISEPVRKKALQFARGDFVGVGEADRMGNEALKIVAVPAQAPDKYQRALRLATNAREADAQDDISGTALGLARYRLELYEEALATLLAFDEPSDIDLAFIAMAQWQLGKRDEARQTLGRLRESLKRPDQDSDKAAAFLREAEELIEGKESTDDPQD